jgi:hypothetical protein
MHDLFGKNAGADYKAYGNADPDSIRGAQAYDGKHIKCLPDFPVVEMRKLSRSTT